MKIPRSMPIVAAFALGVSTLFAAAPSLRVADAKPAQNGQKKDGKRGGMKMMEKRLGLTAGQKARIKPIMENANRQAQKVRADTSLSREQKRAKMRSIRAASRKKISPILTAAQRQKIAAMRKERGNRSGRKN